MNKDIQELLCHGVSSVQGSSVLESLEFNIGIITLNR
jgi:hypothetical protein